MMKFILKLFLTILFIPLFLILLISITARFQLLAPAFWKNAFDTNGTYSKLSVSINRNLVSQTVAEGGRASDIRIFSDLITPENLKDVIERNISNVLQYANGKVNEIIVYIPVNKIPKSLLSSSFGKVSQEMSLTVLLKEFNMSGITPAQIQMISRVSFGSWIFLITFIILSILPLFLLYLLTNIGKRLVAPGVALVLAGVAAAIVVLLGTVIRVNWAKDLAGSVNTGDAMIGIIAPPIIGGVLGVWLKIAVIVIVFGVILFFVKKPGYNVGSKK